MKTAHLFLAGMAWGLFLCVLVFGLSRCGSVSSVIGELGAPCGDPAAQVCSMEVPGVVEEPFPAVLECSGGQWALEELCLEVCTWYQPTGPAWCDADEPPGAYR